MTDHALPRVTVVMPVRNEAGFIATSLGAVLAQDYPAHLLDVIVADGRSDDGTRESIEAIAKTDPRVSLVDNAGRIVATGLNQAIALARGEVIVRVDGHCAIAPNYVRTAVAHLRRGERLAGVGGPLETVGDTVVASAIAAAMSSRFGVGNSAFRTLKGTSRLVDTVAFAAYTRESLAAAGPFDTELVRNQDDEFNYRLRRLGYGLLLADDVRARYFSRGSLRSLWRQYFQYGYWKVRVLQKHPRQMSARQFVPPLFVLALLATPLLPYGWILWLGLTATYLAANAAASMAVARSEGNWQMLPILPIAFAMLHIGYGSGFLVGLARFGARWGSDRPPRSAALASPGVPGSRSLEIPER